MRELEIGDGRGTGRIAAQHGKIDESCCDEMRAATRDKALAERQLGYGKVGNGWDCLNTWTRRRARRNSNIPYASPPPSATPPPSPSSSHHYGPLLGPQQLSRY